ncbi:MAG: hypothetical protein GY865_11365, partial [candidate division Zixibacteria bacterium]|nr:hypothetical protein [candidate division Zixibacteria bacterium]
SFMPIIEKRSSDSIIVIGEQLFFIKRFEFNEALANLMQGPDRWLCACAIYATKEINSELFENIIKEAAEDSDELISETAKYVLNQ